MAARVLRSENFPDLADEVIYPRLSDKKLAWLRERGGERRSFEPGEVLYEHAVRDAPFFVLEQRPRRVRRPQAGQGRPHRPGRRRHLHRRHRRLHRRADDQRLRGRRADRGDRLRPRRPARHGRPLARVRRAHLPHAAGPARLARGGRPRGDAADRAARLAPGVRGARPARAQPAAGALVRRRHRRGERRACSSGCEIPREETPVLVHATNVMRNPSPAQVARSLGLRAEVDGQRFDLVVLGAGPAGLAAAVYGGSEGLRTFVAESWAPGGQAGTSTRIENYLGFPSGIGGRELTTKATLQARRFDAVLSSFHRAVELADGPEGLVRVDLDDGQHVLARSAGDGDRGALARARRGGRRSLPRRRRLPRRDVHRRRALPGQGRRRGRRRQLRRAGRGPPRQPRPQRPRRRPRRDAQVDDVALPASTASSAHRGSR